MVPLTTWNSLVVQGSVHGFEIHYCKYIEKKRTKTTQQPFILFLGKGNKQHRKGTYLWLQQIRGVLGSEEVRIRSYALHSHDNNYQIL